MAVFKCKMCGGALEVNNETVATCSYCGTQQTLPRLDDEKRAQLYDRANYFRRENEFDKAMGIYEMILSDEKNDSEAYWGIVLCRYGIEYVEDPRSHRRIPTVNRAQFTSVFDDEDYKKAIENADSLQKGVYESEAEVIDKIQKGILALSSKEEPFDVFICYKETDNQGNRTQDSVYAQDIYNALVKEGYKVFFSRITLEDKLGSAYEPYIFAALQSAKVMLVVGTNKDNFNAVWVKNEWSRYLSLIKAGKEKTLIPLYKDISPYEMPEEFQYLQSQDMGKIGYIQDVVHGVKKLVEGAKVAVKETVVNSADAQIVPLLKRASMFLEDRDFARADDFYEQVLNMDPENAEAYLGKLLVECGVSHVEDLSRVAQSFENSANYQKTLRFSDSELKAKLQRLKEENEVFRLNGAYAEIKRLAEAFTWDSLIKASKLMQSTEEYQCTEKSVSESRKNAIISLNDAILFQANNKMESNDISTLQLAVKLFKSIEGWKDADERCSQCELKINQIEEDGLRIVEKKQRNDSIIKKSWYVCVAFAVVVFLFSGISIYSFAEDLFGAVLLAILVFGLTSLGSLIYTYHYLFNDEGKNNALVSSLAEALICVLMSMFIVYVKGGFEKLFSTYAVLNICFFVACLSKVLLNRKSK